MEDIRIKKIKCELLYALGSVLLLLFSISTATYAWYVANNKVTATTNKISAKTNGFVLQINDAASGADHGSGVKSLEAFTNGGILSPSSSNDLKDWYICLSADENGKVINYSIPVFDIGPNSQPGQYTLDKKYFAYIRSDYIVYTISETGLADVYLEDDGIEPPITITTKNGSGVSTFIDSIRVGITTEPVDSNGQGTGVETLKVVYAVKNETGKGNDFTAIDGWTSIKDENGSPVLIESTYNHIYGEGVGKYLDQFGNSWVANRDGDIYTVNPNSIPIATNVGYNGIIIHIYIWMEGTDSDCINGKAIENDETKYDVTVKFAGVASNG